MAFEWDDEIECFGRYWTKAEFVVLCVVIFALVVIGGPS